MGRARRTSKAHPPCWQSISQLIGCCLAAPGTISALCTIGMSQRSVTAGYCNQPVVSASYPLVSMHDAGDLSPAATQDLKCSPRSFGRGANSQLRAPMISYSHSRRGPLSPRARPRRDARTRTSSSVVSVDPVRTLA